RHPGDPGRLRLGAARRVWPGLRRAVHGGHRAARRQQQLRRREPRAGLRQQPRPEGPHAGERNRGLQPERPPPGHLARSNDRRRGVWAPAPPPFDASGAPSAAVPSPPMAEQSMVVLDMEGVLVPEIWIAVAERTGVDALRRTTRDEPDYDALMRYRLDLLTEHDLTMPLIADVIAGLDPLP